jgi:hypothetical protein
MAKGCLRRTPGRRALEHLGPFDFILAVFEGQDFRTGSRVVQHLTLWMVDIGFVS